MKLIVGLGNPGPEYEHTRHNAGFIMLDRYATTLQPTPSWQHSFNSLIASMGNGARKFLLAKPQTFMNHSGSAVAEILRFYKLSAHNVLVIHDDVDLRLGAWKITDNSSSAGHKGVQDIIDAIQTQEFTRIRVGIDSRVDRTEIPTENFVLEEFSSAEGAKLNEVFPPIAQHLRAFLEL
ncbi:MAG: aminoacyl-tRNA hydrolase [Candidatus Doudnabacteria bacterium RIFCSPHIGHO2_01_FULL_50_11]|uniref:Peptidyl-tRNA hydrolase n=1 Tax=Candidatus Doudnabacteria bacterium RIFCSPHIGHO2_01_FULL_50_11 TaxID=1817828 RepID=A0A1F5PG37_9BACT|nr:MAG: aminoacyl-tRNA hydrolase [Candidatus Doudnabacteria bacterium RIFCSPHIGHO2_01_FULL_50_11]